MQFAVCRWCIVHLCWKGLTLDTMHVVLNTNRNMSMVLFVCLCFCLSMFFLFDCPAYSSIRASHANLFQCACSVSDFFDSCEANACGGFIRNCFSLRSNILIG